MRGARSSLALGLVALGLAGTAALVSGCSRRRQAQQAPRTPFLSHPPVRGGGHVTSIAFSPDGVLLAGGAAMPHRHAMGAVFLWRVADGTLLRTCRTRMGPIGSVAFSPDGTLLASGSDKDPNRSAARLWRVSDGRLHRALPGALSARVAFHPNGRTLAVGNWRLLMLYRVPDGDLLNTVNGYTENISSVTYSPDGQVLASADWGGSVRFRRGQEESFLRASSDEPAPIYALAFSPDGRVLATAGADRAISLWRTADWRLARTLTGHSSDVRSVAFSPDGQILASGAGSGERGDPGDRSVRLWRVSDGTPLRILQGHAELVMSVAFSPDGALVASGSRDRTVRLWRTRDGELLRVLPAAPPRLPPQRSGAADRRRPARNRAR